MACEGLAIGHQQDDGLHARLQQLPLLFVGIIALATRRPPRQVLLPGLPPPSASLVPSNADIHPLHLSFCPRPACPTSALTPLLPAHIPPIFPCLLHQRLQEASECDAVAVHGLPDVAVSSCSSGGPELTDAHVLALLPLHGLTHLSLGGLRAVQVSRQAPHKCGHCSSHALFNCGSCNAACFSMVPLAC